MELKDFWLYVDRPSQVDLCWNWVRGVDKDGYGVLRVGKQIVYAHRIAWSLIYGEIESSDILVCHTCDNPACCNPNHLFLGTTLDNMQDKVKKGRQSKGNTHGAILHPESRPKGEQVKTSILKEKDIHKIISLRGSGLFQREIAKIIGCSRSAISHVLNGYTWNSVLTQDEKEQALLQARMVNEKVEHE